MYTETIMTCKTNGELSENRLLLPVFPPVFQDIQNYSYYSEITIVEIKNEIKYFAHLNASICSFYTVTDKTR